MPTIGVIGLGVMGENIVLNMADHNINVLIYNRTVSKTKQLATQSEYIKGFDKVENFIEALPSPKIILMMITAGEAVDKCLESFKLLLSNDDIVIDGGNSHYIDTMRRYNTYTFNYVGCGISGGAYGARNGPAMFFGCKEGVYNSIKNIFETISAKHNGVPCCGRMGDDGAGHFVKIVHNGIEYCEMQILQEIINILDFECKSLNDPLIRKVFEEINTGKTKGYLVEICEKILKTKNDSGLLLEQIIDKAEQKGTGKMCVYAGLETDTSISAITESVFARYISSNKNRRLMFSSAIKQQSKLDSVDTKNTIGVAVYKKAFYLAKAICYIQGCDLLSANKAKNCWTYNIADVCTVWRNGCILRCEFLSDLKKMAENVNLETSDIFVKIYEDCIDCLKELCLYSIENEIHCPVLLSCYSWLSALKKDEGNGTLIQAMRDYFGKHTVLLKTGERVSIDWYE